MRFEDERWVKVFIRDTTNWKLLPWQAKCLLSLLFRKVDCAGRIDVGNNHVRSLAAMVDLPMEVVEAGLAGLIACNEGDEPTAVIDGRDLVLVKFAEAQNANASAKARQREWRARRKVALDTTIVDNNATSTNSNVALCLVDVASPNVDAERRDVTRRNDQRRGEETEKKDLNPLAALGHPSPKKPTGRTRRERGERLPAGWTPTDETVRVVRDLGLEPSKILGAFRDHWAADGSDRAWKVNWDAAFRQWARKDLEFKSRGGSRPQLAPVAKSPTHREFVPSPPFLFDEIPALNGKGH